MTCKHLLLFALVLILFTGCSGASLVTAYSHTPDLEQASTDVVSEAEPAQALTVPAGPVKNAYLTIDDGPNSHFTGIYLDILKKYNAKATFVVVGSNIERNPEVFRRILDEGHSIANHTFSHDYKKIYASPEAFLEDLDRGNKSISAITGSEVKMFRAPGGASRLTSSFNGVLDSHGYKHLGWNVSSADSDPNGISSQQIIDNIKNGVIAVEKMEKSPIILIHDGTEINLGTDKPGTAVHNYIRSRESGVAALPEVIEFLLDRGYTLAGADENTPAAW